MPKTRAQKQSKQFHEILRQIGELHDKKAADYGNDDDLFANIRAMSDWGIPGWVGAMTKVSDKVQRLKTFARRGTLVNEGVIDSFLDLAVYAIIALLMYLEERSD